MSAVWMQGLLWYKNGDPMLNDDGTQSTMFDLLAAVGEAHRRHGRELDLTTHSDERLRELAEYLYQKLQEKDDKNDDGAEG